MNADQSKQFKDLVKPQLDRAVELHGGIDKCRELYRDIPAMLYFLAGVVFGALAPLNQEEVRRLLDLVRLRLESDSATS